MKNYALWTCLLALTTLTGCSSQPEIAYWTDSSYKSAMDYEAEQKYELKDDLKSVHTALNELVDSGTMDNMETTEDFEDTKTESDNNSTVEPVITMSRENPIEAVAFVREQMKLLSGLESNSHWYSSYYNNNISGEPITGIPAEMVRNYQSNNYLDIVAVARSQGINDDTFYTNCKGFINQIFASCQVMPETPAQVEKSIVVEAIQTALAQTTIKLPE